MFGVAFEGGLIGDGGGIGSAAGGEIRLAGVGEVDGGVEERGFVLADC